MSDLRWKIEDGVLLTKAPGEAAYREMKLSAFDAATILQSAILATQEKCAQVAETANGPGEYWLAVKIASAIRSLNLTEPPHE